MLVLQWLIHAAVFFFEAPPKKGCNLCPGLRAGSNSPRVVPAVVTAFARAKKKLSLSAMVVSQRLISPKVNARFAMPVLKAAQKVCFSLKPQRPGSNTLPLVMRVWRKKASNAAAAAMPAKWERSSFNCNWARSHSLLSLFLTVLGAAHVCRHVRSMQLP